MFADQETLSFVYINAYELHNTFSNYYFMPVLRITWLKHKGMF